MTHLDLASSKQGTYIFMPYRCHLFRETLFQSRRDRTESARAFDKQKNHELRKRINSEILQVHLFVSFNQNILQIRDINVIVFTIVFYNSLRLQ